jgi:hypothetical protein
MYSYWYYLPLYDDGVVCIFACLVIIIIIIWIITTCLSVLYYELAAYMHTLLYGYGTVGGCMFSGCIVSNK